jgi:hypothetical protein
MAIQKYIDRMNYLYKLIDNESTGTPEELAVKLHLSKRHTFNLLNDLKDLGAEIKYNRIKRTYYFSNCFLLSINVEVEISNNIDHFD